MKLQTKLDEIAQQFAANAPPEAAALMKQSTEDLIQSGIMESVLRQGDTAPVFSLPDREGTMVDSRTLLARGPLVLTFYRGVW